MADFDTVVRTRRSVRQYLPTPVPRDIVTKVMDAAQHSPSNCNTQPWQVHILSGEIKATLSRLITVLPGPRRGSRRSRRAARGPQAESVVLRRPHTQNHLLALAVPAR
ncbi:nitroreductase family protein [Mycobacterium sp. BMJ-28]